MTKTNNKKTTQEDDKKVVKKTSNPKDYSTKNVIIGLLLFVSVLSIGYSTTVIVMGTEGIVPLVMVAPQAILGAVIAIKQFCK